MSVAQALADAGIVRPDEVIELAAATRLPVPRAAVMLTKESSGGHMLWGRDGVSTGGAYTKGGPVTRENYLAYRALVRAGTITMATALERSSQPEELRRLVESGGTVTPAEFEASMAGA